MNYYFQKLQEKLFQIPINLLIAYSLDLKFQLSSHGGVVIKLFQVYLMSLKIQRGFILTYSQLCLDSICFGIAEYLISERFKKKFPCFIIEKIKAW